MNDDLDTAEDEIEERIINHQIEKVVAHYGKKIQANWGWGIDFDEDIGPIVSTKIYANPRVILTTVELPDGSFRDTWEEVR